MARALPPLTWFRAFDSAARHLSFTAAAQELGLTQSAISQHIRALESRFGTPLFLRKPRGLALTDAGRRLLPDVAAALGRLQIASDAFDTGSSEGLVTIATSVSVAQWIIAPALARFQAQHPQIRLRIISTLWPDDFAASTADLEIRFGAASVVGKGATVLGTSRRVAVARPDRCAPWPQILAGPLIQPVGISDTWDAIARLLGLPPPPPPGLLVDSHGLAVDAALAGAGVALTSSLIAGPSLRAGHLMALPLPVADMQEAYFCALKDGPVRENANLFLQWIRAECDPVD